MSFNLKHPIGLRHPVELTLGGMSKVMSKVTCTCQKRPIHIKRDQHMNWEASWRLRIQTDCRADFGEELVEIAAVEDFKSQLAVRMARKDCWADTHRETHNSHTKKPLTHTQRDLQFTHKETHHSHTKRPLIHTLAVRMTKGLLSWPTHVKRDLKIWKETYTCKKRPTRTKLTRQKDCRADFWKNQQLH